MAGKNARKDTCRAMRDRPMLMPGDLSRDFIRHPDPTAKKVTWYYKTHTGQRGGRVDDDCASALEQRYQRWFAEEERKRRAVHDDVNDPNIVGRLIYCGVHYKRDYGRLWWTTDNDIIGEALVPTLERVWQKAGMPRYFAGS